MTFKFFYLLLLIAYSSSSIFGVVSLFSPKHLEAASLVNYQGKLMTSSSVAVADGTYNIEFKLYTASSGGSTVWTETRTGANKVQVTSGLFTVLLGEVTSLVGVDFDQSLYLGVNIGGTGSASWDGEMTPRKTLASVPSAFLADTAKALNATNATSTNLRTTNATTTNLTATTITTTNATISSGLTTGTLNVGSLSGLLFGTNGAVSAVATSSLGLITTDVSEGSNLYFTNTRADTRADLRIGVASSTIRAMLSSSATGLAYDNSSGVFSLTSGYNIPLTASTTEWAAKVSSQWTTSGSNIYFNTGNIGIGSTTPSAKLTVVGTTTVSGDINILTVSGAEGSLMKNGARLVYASTTLNNYFFGTAGNLTLGGTHNIFMGSNTGSLTTSSSANRNIGIGDDSQDDISNGIDNVSIGYNALSDGVISNTAVGNYALTTATGNYNTALGFRAGDSITSGSQNIIIGYDIDLGPSVTASNSYRLNIGNLIFGTNVDGSGSTMSTGNIGIGTTTPSAKLSITGTAGTGDIFRIASSTDTSLLSVDYTGALSGGSAGLTLKAGGTNQNIVLIPSGTGSVVIDNLSPYSPKFTASNGYFNIGRIDQGTTNYVTLGNSSRQGIAVTSAGGLFWSNTTTDSNSPIGGSSNYTALMRNTAGPGVLEINNGDAGTWRDLIVRNLSLGTTSTSTTLTLQGAAGKDALLVASSTGTQMFSISQSGTATFGTAGTLAGTIVVGQAASINGNITIGGTANQVLSGNTNSLGSTWQIVTDNTGSGGPAEFRLGSTGQLSFGNTAANIGTIDSNISRVRAGVLGIGTGSNGSVAGTLIASSIGLGTSTPAAKFAIHDNSGAVGTTPVFMIASSTSANLATSTLFTVLGSGNVGVGTLSPSYTLEVTGTAKVSGVLTVNTGTIQGGYGGSGRFLIGGASGGFFYNPNTEMTFNNNTVLGWTAGINGPGNNSQDTGISRISAGVIGIGSGSAGNISGALLANTISIGTTSPFAKLAIQGTYGSTTALFSIASTTSSVYATSSVFTVLANGNVGIATTTPGYALTVSGDISLTGALRANGNAGTSGYVLQSTGTGTQWVATSSLGITGGGGGSPSGSSGAIQYNNGGSFGGFGSWNGTNLVLSSGQGLSIAGGAFSVNGSGDVGTSGTLSAGILSIASGNFTVDGSGNMNAYGSASFGNSQLAIDSSGNFVYINGIAASFPSSQGSNGDVLTNDGSGNLTWGPAGGSAAPGGSSGQIQFNSTGVLDGFGSWDGTTLSLGSGALSVGGGNFSVDGSGNITAGTASLGGGKFTTDSNGNITKINNVSYNFPSSQASSGYILGNDGGGNLSWISPPSNGSNGSDGAQGPQGNDGPQGPQGNTGSNGQDGQTTHPGGSSNQIQYNDAGAFGGFGSWDGTTLNLSSGLLSAASNAFSVNQYGDITANSASVGSLAVGGGTLTVGSNGSLSIASNNVYLDSSGSLSAAAGAFTVDSSGNINTGTISAVNGGFVVNGSGNVGIQNSNPGYALDVTGNINVTNILYQDGTAGATCTGDVTTTVNGVVIGCGLSDARYKTDIITMATTTLDKLDQLNAVSFHWNDVYKDKYTNNTDLQFGFIAQEVQGIFPDLVSQDKDGYFSVRYGQMTAILTSGIQELYAMIKDLKTQIADISNTLSDKVVHIKETITGTLRVEDKVCVDDVCVTKNQFKQMLINNGANNGGSDDSGSSTVTSMSAPSISSSGVSGSSDSAPVPESVSSTTDAVDTSSTDIPVVNTEVVEVQPEVAPEPSGQTE